MLDVGLECLLHELWIAGECFGGGDFIDGALVVSIFNSKGK